MVVCAGDDLMFPPEHSRAVAAGIAGAELVMLPGASHGVVVERPEDVAELIDRFVGGVVMRQTVTDGP
jgi:pimeloyl-ACP methyl ester carboxylesterase